MRSGARSWRISRRKVRALFRAVYCMRALAIYRRRRCDAMCPTAHLTHIYMPAEYLFQTGRAPARRPVQARNLHCLFGAYTRIIKNALTRTYSLMWCAAAVSTIYIYIPPPIYTSYLIGRSWSFRAFHGTIIILIIRSVAVSARAKRPKGVHFAREHKIYLHMRIYCAYFRGCWCAEARAEGYSQKQKLNKTRPPNQRRPAAGQALRKVVGAQKSGAINARESHTRIIVGIEGMRGA